MLRHIVMPWRHSVSLWHKHICKYRINDRFELVNPKYYRNKQEIKKNHLASTSTSWDRVPLVFDVMTWRHDVTLSCKYKTDNIFELSNPKFHRNKKRIIFLAHLQAEIGKINLGALCCDVMTSRYGMKTSCKHIHDYSLEPSNRNNYRNTCVSSL